MSLRHRFRIRGFVPIELLAIVAITVLLLGITLPAIAHSRAKTRATQCLNNHRQIAHAWQLYAAENNGTCVNNYTIPNTLATIQAATFENWANNVMTWATSSTEGRSVTNRVSAASGRLHPYTSGDILIYKCPADTYLSPAQRAAAYPQRLRSVAMNALIGQPERPPNLNGRSWAFGGQYRQWLKVNQIPTPAATWLTIDEHPDSINDGFFLVSPGSTTWADTPATHHGNATPFSFADGHVELRKWRSTAALMPVRYRYETPRPFNAAGRTDFTWYLEHTGLVPY